MRKLLFLLAIVVAVGGFAMYDVAWGWGGGGGGGGGWGGGGWGGGGWGGGAPGGRGGTGGNAGKKPGGRDPGRRDPGDVEDNIKKGAKYNKEFEFSFEEKDENTHHRAGVYSLLNSW